MPAEVTSIQRFGDLERALTDTRSRTALFKDRKFTTELDEKLTDLLEGRSILSLDVFDTLLLRDDSCELTRFYEIGKEMSQAILLATGKKVSQVECFLARHFGTKATYRASEPIRGCKEGSLTEIHTTASRILVGNTDLANSFISAEIDYEKSRLSANGFLKEFMERYRASGGKVALVTDMYMHAEQVSSLLSAFDIGPDAYDCLVSSADHKVTKASGLFFEVVEEKFSATADEFVHIGDSLTGDFLKPKARGWQALHLPLSTAGVDKRRADHLKTSEYLKEKYGLSIDVAMPK